MREVGFAQAYSFKYSPRPGTPAAAMDAQVPEAVKDERLAALQALLRDAAGRVQPRTVGRIVPVLFERQGRSRGQLVGRTPYLQAVHVDGARVAASARIVDVRDRRRAAQQPGRRARARRPRARAEPHGDAPRTRQRRRRADPAAVRRQPLLPLLFGEHDHHLARIEQQLGVSLVLARQPRRDHRPASAATGRARRADRRSTSG